jgi:hypothetical protein
VQKRAQIGIELNDDFAMNHTLLSNVFVWIGIPFCITQSAVFSGADSTRQCIEI